MSADEIHPIFYKIDTITSVEIMEWVDREPALVYAKSWGDTTLLHIAADKGYLDLVHFLLMRGADSNLLSRWGTPLFKSATTEIAQLLLDHGAILSNTNFDKSLDRACRSNRPEVLKFLLEQEQQHNEDFSALLANSELIYVAAEYPENSDDCSCLRILIDKGANINVQVDWTGYTALNYAARSNSIARFELLMSLGAKFERTTLYRFAKDKVAAYIRERYPELTAPEWVISANEIKLQKPGSALYFLQDGRSFISHEVFHQIILWRIEDGVLNPVRGIQLNRDFLRAISVSPDGLHFIVPIEFGQIQIRSSHTLELVNFLQFPSDQTIELAEYSPCGKFIITTGERDGIYVFNLKTGKITVNNEPFNRQSICFSFAHQSRFFSFFSIETGGGESGIFRLDPNGKTTLIEAYMGDEDYSSLILMHPTLPVFMLNGRIYAYDIEKYLELKEKKNWREAHRFAATLKWKFNLENLPKESLLYFFKKYLVLRSLHKLTYYTMGSGKIVAEHFFDLEEGSYILHHVLEINKLLLFSSDGIKLIDNPIQI